MAKHNRNLDTETQLLISAGAAVAAGCIPCLETIVKMARQAGVEDWKLKIAAKTGQFVKDKPIEMMKACADDLLGTHLQTREGKERLSCPGMPAEQTAAESPAPCGCAGTPQTAAQDTGGCSC